MSNTEKQITTPTSIVYLRKTKHGFAIVGKHTNDMTESAEKWLKERYQYKPKSVVR